MCTVRSGAVVGGTPAGDLATRRRGPASPGLGAGAGRSYGWAVAAAGRRAGLRRCACAGAGPGPQALNPSRVGKGAEAMVGCVARRYRIGDPGFRAPAGAPEVRGESGCCGWR